VWWNIENRFSVCCFHHCDVVLLNNRLSTTILLLKKWTNICVVHENRSQWRQSIEWHQLWKESFAASNKIYLGASSGAKTLYAVSNKSFRYSYLLSRCFKGFQVIRHNLQFFFEFSCFAVFKNIAKISVWQQNLWSSWILDIRNNFKLKVCPEALNSLVLICGRHFTAVLRNIFWK